MAKQTIKQRKALRSAAARKGWETRRKPSPEQDAAQERAMGFSDGVRITTDFYEGCMAMRRGAREMIPNDIETATLRCQRVRREVEREFEAARPLSLWQRIKRWFA